MEMVVKSFAFALAIALGLWPTSALAGSVVGFHIQAGQNVHGTLRCQFGTNSITCVPSLPFEFQSVCKTGDREFGLGLLLTSRPRGYGCTKRPFHFTNTAYHLRANGTVHSPDGRLTCNYAKGWLHCWHPHSRGSFE